MFFVIKTEEAAAEQHFGHRVRAYNGEGVLQRTSEFNEERSVESNHRSAALAALFSMSGVPGYTPHRIVGTAPVPGTGYWVTMVMTTDRGTLERE